MRSRTAIPFLILLIFCFQVYGKQQGEAAKPESKILANKEVKSRIAFNATLGKSHSPFTILWIFLLSLLTVGVLAFFWQTLIDHSRKCKDELNSHEKNLKLMKVEILKRMELLEEQEAGEGYQTMTID
eukprot:TRINITY_DN932_c0_g9_i1.p1 TRINITY_DN932_c0_g9~~TRINITY_DN932_c0_g9_i1.p1  ORF type:complete len:128 (+),score=28.59 TRINITY_DN932_c0_g9_i1:111-494(+)